MDFETILLKNIISSSELFSKVFHLIKPKYFKEIGNKNVFKFISEYYTEYRKIPAVVELISKVKDTENEELRKEIAKSLKNVNDSGVSDNIDFMCDETITWIKDALYLEALLIGSEGLQKKSEDLKLKAQALMDERSKISIDENLGLDFDDTESFIKHFSERNIGVKTGHKELDKRLGNGFLPGTLNVVCAAAGIGKSAMMTDLASSMLKDGKNILLVSLEMSDFETMKRIYANVLDIEANSFSDLSKTAGELQALDRTPTTKDDILAAYQKYQMTGKCGKFFVKDYPAGSFSALELEGLVKKFQEQQGVKFDIIFVDYLGICKSHRVSQSSGMYNYLKSIGEEIRASAKVLGLPIISASQLNRSAVNQIDDVNNSAISDSLGTVMTADMLIFLLQNEQMKQESKILFKITKNRYTGITDTFMMDIDYPKMTFHDVITENGSSFMSNQEKTQADNYAKSELKSIHKQDIENLKKADSVKDDMDEIFKGLGL